MRRLEGKVAIVTASSQGIGFAIAERLGLEGAAVVVSSRKQVRLAPLLYCFNFFVFGGFFKPSIGVSSFGRTE